MELGILDISDKKSIAEFADFIKNKYQKIDILINNAGFAFKVIGQMKQQIIFFC